MIDLNTDINISQLAAKLATVKLAIGKQSGPTITVKATTGAPGAIVEPAGSLCINIVDFKVYISGGAGTWGILTSATPA